MLWAVQAGLPLKIWGQGWSKWVDPKLVVADYLPNQQLAGQFNIRSIPTLLIVKDGVVQEQMVGAMNKAALKAKLDAHI